MEYDGNSGNTNVLFQIDNIQTEIDFNFIDEFGEVEDILRLAVNYKINLTTTKPFLSPELETPKMVIASPAAIEQEILFRPTADPLVWEADFYIPNLNRYRGIPGILGSFTVYVHDYHNVSASLEKLIPVDTQPPNPPVLEPSIELPSREEAEYEKAGFPLHFFNGTYYTNSNAVFLTGYTDEFLDIIATIDIGEDRTEIFFTQTETTKVFDDVLATPGVLDHVRVEGDLREVIDTSAYVGFGTEKTQIGSMRAYGDYGKFYDTTSIQFVGGDEQYTQANVYPDLELVIPKNTPVFFYDKDTPSFWFGVYIPLLMYETSTVFLKVFDEAGNIARYPLVTDDPSRIVIYYDPSPPIVLSHYPFTGSTVLDTFIAEIEVKKEIKGAPLDFESINFSINGEEIPFNIEVTGTDESYIYYKIWYAMSDLDDDEYEFSIHARDHAGNDLDESSVSATWTTIVDQSAPLRPDFFLIGGTEFEGRWYVRTSPEFTLDFTDNEEPINIVGISLSDALTNNEAASCTNGTYNNFSCVFPAALAVDTEGFGVDYGIVVDAFKTLDDGSRTFGFWGPDGMEFTVDPYPPEVSNLNMKSRIRDNFNLTFTVDILNERHPLRGTVLMDGVLYDLASLKRNSTYTFVWPVPDFSIDDDVEGDHPIVVTIADYAGNEVVLDRNMYLDLTPPRIKNVGVAITDSIEVGTIGNETLYATARTIVAIEGEFIDDDIAKVWITPGDYNEQLRVYEDKTDAEIIYDENGYPRTFTVDANLRGAPGKTELNQITLFVEDIAGHIITKIINIRKDLEAPETPRFTIGGPSIGGPAPTKVEVCHDDNTIEVDDSALQSHLDHGDYEGACTST